MSEFLIERGDEGLDLILHGSHLLAHVQNDFDAGEIHPQITSEFENHFQAFQIVVGVEARIAFTARGGEQPFALVEAQGLRMDLVLLGDGRDHVGGFGSGFGHGLHLGPHFLARIFRIHLR